MIADGCPPRKIQIDSHVYEWKSGDFECLLDDYFLSELCNGRKIAYQERILDKAETEYLKAVIRPFKGAVSRIVKISSGRGEEFICISYHDNSNVGTDSMRFPSFKENTMYKNMVADRPYSLEELGL